MPAATFLADVTCAFASDPIRIQKTSGIGTIRNSSWTGSNGELTAEITRAASGGMMKQYQIPGRASLASARQPIMQGSPPQGLGPSRQSTSERLQLFDVASKFFIGIAGLILSGIIGFATLEFNGAANERQAHAQIDAARVQRDNVGAQVATSLSSLIAKGSDEERELALTILGSIAPEQAQRIAATLAVTANTSVRLRDAAKQIVAAAPTVKRNQDFAQHLMNAEAYEQFLLFPNEARQYFAAFEALSDSEKQKIRSQVDAARQAYDRGKFSVAAESLRNAMKLLNQ